MGPFLQARQQFKCLIVAVDYFTRWIDVETVATFTASRIKSFHWKNINCRFGVPKAIISAIELSFPTLQFRSSLSKQDQIDLFFSRSPTNNWSG